MRAITTSYGGARGTGPGGLRGIAQYETDTGTGIDTSAVPVMTPVVDYSVAQTAFNQLPVVAPGFSTEASDIAAQTAAYGGAPYGTPTPTPATNGVPVAAWFGLAAAVGVLVLGSMFGGKK